MKSDYLGFIFSIVVISEIAVYCMAGFCVFLKWGYTCSEAVSYAIVSTLMALAFFIQVGFLVGIPEVALILEVVIFLLAIILIWRSLDCFKQASEASRSTLFARHPIPLVIIGICMGYLMIQAIQFHPKPLHHAIFNYLIEFQKHRTFFITDDSIQGMFPLNSYILPHLFLRFGTQTGIGILGYLAYISIGFCTYTLARRYSWVPTSFTVALIVMSMPRLIYHATSPGYEIIPAAASIFSILALYRLLEQPGIRDMIFLMFGILFGISGSSMSLVFPIILMGLSCVVLIRRHGTMIWGKLIVQNWKLFTMALIPMVVFSQTAIFLFNLTVSESWTGYSILPMVKNPDDLIGSVANLTRYFTESAHFTQPLNILCQRISGIRMIEIFQQFHHHLFDSYFGNKGAAVPFAISWSPNEMYSWFGPLPFFLMQPAVLFALIRGSRQLKAVSLALIFYLYIIILIPAWAPENVRFFTIFYVCSGFLVAFLLPPWRLTRTGRVIIQIVCSLLLLYGCIIDRITH